MAAAAAAGVAFGLFLSLTPELRRQIVHKCATTNERYQTGPLSDTAKAAQQFVPQYENLVSIAVLIDRQGDSANEGMIRLTVYDTEGQICAVSDRPVCELETNNWEFFEVDAKLAVGETYFFSLETVAGGEALSTAVYRPMHIDRIAENAAFFYGGGLIPDASAACQYVYRLPAGILECCISVLFGAFFGLLAGDVICRCVLTGDR